MDEHSASSSKTGKVNTISNSIEKHGESIVFLAKMVAAEHAKNCQESCAEQEKICQETHAEQEGNQMDAYMKDICARINRFHNNERTMVLWMVEPTVANNKTVVDTILQKVRY